MRETLIETDIFWFIQLLHDKIRPYPEQQLPSRDDLSKCFHAFQRVHYLKPSICLIPVLQISSDKKEESGYFLKVVQTKILNSGTNLL